MAKTDVILLKPVSGLGAESDQVSVAAGYARNYLIPHGMAVSLTSSNKRQMEALKARRQERESAELTHMKDLSKSLERLVLIIKMKSGDDGKLFGSVTNSMIADELRHQFEVDLDRKKINLEEPIKSLGDHEVELKLHPDVTGHLKLRIESTNPKPEPEQAPAK